MRGALLKPACLCPRSAIAPSAQVLCWQPIARRAPHRALGGLTEFSCTCSGSRQHKDYYLWMVYLGHQDLQCVVCKRSGLWLQLPGMPPPRAALQSKSHIKALVAL